MPRRLRVDMNLSVSRISVPKARGIDREHVRVGHDLQHLDAVLDVREEKEEDLTVRVRRAQPMDGRARQHGRAHLGQLDEQHLARIRADTRRA